MKYPQAVQENQFPIISAKVTLCNDHELINIRKSLPANWKSISSQKAKIAIYHTFEESIASQTLDNLYSVREAIERMANRAALQYVDKISYQKILNSETGKNLIATADKYHIPYNNVLLRYLV